MANAIRWKSGKILWKHTTPKITWADTGCANCCPTPPCQSRSTFMTHNVMITVPSYTLGQAASPCTPCNTGCCGLLAGNYSCAPNGGSLTKDSCGISMYLMGYSCPGGAGHSGCCNTWAGGAVISCGVWSPSGLGNIYGIACIDLTAMQLQVGVLVSGQFGATSPCPIFVSDLFSTTLAITSDADALTLLTNGVSVPWVSNPRSPSGSQDVCQTSQTATLQLL